MIKKFKENSFYIVLLFVLMIFTAVYYVILKKEKFSEDVSGYLKYVPVIYEYGLENEKGPYSGETVSIDDLSQGTLLTNVYYNLEPLKYNILFKNDECPLGICYGKRAEYVRKIKKNMKKYYNIDKINVDKFDVPIGKVYLNDKYFIEVDYDKNGSLPVKYSEVIKYKKEKNRLIIYERAGFYVKHRSKGELPTLHASTNDNDIVTKLTNKDNSIEEGQKYFNDNKGKFKIYKHIFKLNKKHEYYYYKTEKTK